MEAQDIAIYGGLAYLIYRLTRPAEAPVAAGPGGPAYVPVPPPAQPVLAVVGAGPPSPPLETLILRSPSYVPVGPSAPAPQSGAPTVPVTPVRQPINEPTSWTLLSPGSGPTVSWPGQMQSGGWAGTTYLPAGSVVQTPAGPMAFTGSAFVPWTG